MFGEGYIYRIFNDKDNYIGSTVKNIQQRLECHEIDYGLWILNNFKKGYVSSFEILKNKNYQIEVIDIIDVYFDGEKYNKHELFKMEKFYINNSKCVNLQFNRSNRKMPNR